MPILHCLVVSIPLKIMSSLVGVTIHYHSQYMESHKSHVPNHQAVRMFPQQTGDVSWLKKIDQPSIQHGSQDLMLPRRHLKTWSAEAGNP